MDFCFLKAKDKLYTIIKTLQPEKKGGGNMSRYESIEKRIARCLVMAQSASDGGKGIRDLYESLKGTDCYYAVLEANKQGYERKDDEILRALNLIASARNKSGFHFYVAKRAWDVTPYLVYFNFHIGKKRYQISFHTFLPLEKWVNTSHTTRWDHRDSREAARKLAVTYLAKGGRKK